MQAAIDIHLSSVLSKLVEEYAKPFRLILRLPRGPLIDIHASYWESLRRICLPEFKDLVTTYKPSECWDLGCLACRLSVTLEDFFKETRVISVDPDGEDVWRVLEEVCVQDAIWTLAYQIIGYVTDYFRFPSNEVAKWADEQRKWKGIDRGLLASGVDHCYTFTLRWAYISVANFSHSSYFFV
jgi:hypothetical protein